MTRYAFVGPGVVVTKDEPDYSLMLRNPGKISGWVCECGHGIELQGGIAICNECGKQYRRTGEKVERLDGEWVKQPVVRSA